jgi:hypothetical protein
MSWDDGFVTVPIWLLNARPSSDAVTVYTHVVKAGVLDMGTGLYVQCHVTEQALSEWSALGEQTIRQALRELETLGAIEGERLDEDTVTYTTLPQPDGGAR